MKRTWQCPKCASDRIGYLESLPDGAYGKASVDRKIAMEQVGNVFGVVAHQPAGEVEAFVCTSCGYFEEYVRDPQAIDWSKVKGFRWCRPPA
ncbi:MAG: hypothetical protein KF729_31740 [Sandaracinaceae bacterium]|nr:hypothetical protein [Sandaracinaceae bacterium]